MEVKTVILDFDDFSVANNKLPYLFTLKSFYPNLKVSLFTIPYDIENEGKMSPPQRKQTLKNIRSLDWIELIPHGLVHTPREMEYTGYGSMKKFIIPSIEKAFKKDNLPYIKGFKAPQWKWSKDVVRALDEVGWFGASNIHDKNMPRTKKDYVYQFNIDKAFWESDLDTWKLHGHITNEMQDGIERCMDNLLKIPHNAIFKFISEVI
jgi:hypothetical protein